MWRILHRLFGWDYVAWWNSADQGIARVHVDGMDRVYYWPYKCIASADFITEPERVIWLTCRPEKYMPTRCGAKLSTNR
jgi:hypothetical protein